MIGRLPNKEVYNPIRDHINMRFEIIDEETESNNNELPLISEIARDLEKQKFDPEKSRVLIFAFSRKKTENSVELLKNELDNLGLPYSDKVDFYHAGLTGIEREEKFENFQKGKTVILISTKAFGMGMDIKNIHYIYHLGPSSSFEDFLQEVGRAGRNKEMLEAAGFSNENPISTCCYMKKNDFKAIKDRNHKSQIAISDIQEVFELVVEYINKFKNIDEVKKIPFSIPSDLYNQQTASKDDKSTFFRLCLYWLERFKRIELGMFAPAQYPLELTKKKFDNITFETPEEKKIHNFLIELNEYQADKNIERSEIIIESHTLQKWLKIHPSEIISHLLKAQKMGFIILNRKISLIPTKTKKIEFPENGNFKGLTIKAVFKLARVILEQSKLGNQIQIENEFLESETKDIISSVFNKENIKNLIQEKDSIEEIITKFKTDFIEKRRKFALLIINNIPKIKCKADLIIEEDKLGEKVYSIYNGYEKHQDWKDYLDVFEKETRTFIEYISKEYYNAGEKSYNIFDLMIELNITEEQELQKVVSISKWLGYLKGFGGSITAMGIECYVNNTIAIDHEDQTSDDYKIAQEFDESNKMKELRLYALECLSQLSNENQDQFIKKYFKAGSTNDLILLLEEEFGENHPNLQAFRAEALDREEKKLNPEQMAVYNAPLRENLQVIAGPGSGKTHTLTLRVARLVQKEKVDPENILVLAYNRAVVIELKERLGKLFKSLGYVKLIKRLKIYTFHSFVKSILKDKLDNLDFNQWTTKILELANSQPGSIDQSLGNVDYVFVDEFQDITNERLELLQHVANPSNCNICVIGDPNQSIYGYQRADVGESRDPKPYYHKFSTIYNPTTSYLKKNYRSLPNILAVSEELLDLNISKFKDMPILEAQRIPENDSNYCETIDFEEIKIKWKDKLIEILTENSSNGNKAYNQVAIMFRSNNEVFKAYSTLQSIDFRNYRIRIQGANSSPYKSREFHYFINRLNTFLTKKIPANFKDRLLQHQKKVIEKYPTWDRYLLDLFYCLVLEYYTEKDENSTYGDLIIFIEEIANKDDGHLSKIYQNQINEFYKESIKQEIVITTMHKVKGIEFDAVLIPPSFTNLPLKKNEEELDEANLLEILDEERRLYYVAYTRAKYRLTIIEWEREKALRKNIEYQLPEAIELRLGINIPEGIDKYFISWGAKSFNELSNNYIRDYIKIGDKLEIKQHIHNGNSYFQVYHNITQIGQIANNLEKNKKYKGIISKLLECKKLNGYRVSSIEVYTYKESKIYDEKHNKTFADNWSKNSIDRGYIYLVDFSGYGKGINK